MLQEFVESTGYHRVYAAWLLRHLGGVRVGHGVVVVGDAGVREKGGHATEYGPEVEAVLKKVWETMDYICGKRLVAVLPEVVRCLVEQGELEVRKDVLEKLERVSAATIDRLLAPERSRVGVGRSQGRC